MGFPKEMPVEAIGHIVDYLRGVSSHTIAEVVEDAYIVLGYGLYLGFGEGHPDVFGGTPVESLSQDDQALALENVLSQGGEKTVDWVLIVSIILQIIQTLRKK